MLGEVVQNRTGCHCFQRGLESDLVALESQTSSDQGFVLDSLQLLCSPTFFRGLWW